MYTLESGAIVTVVASEPLLDLLTPNKHSGKIGTRLNSSALVCSLGIALIPAEHRGVLCTCWKAALRGSSAYQLNTSL